MSRRLCLLLALVFAVLVVAPANAADEPDLIFSRSTVFKWLSPNDKLATYGLDDPEVDGVACHFTVPEKGGFKGWIGARRGGVRHLARVPPDRPDPLQGEIRAGRRHVPPAPLAVLQEDADRARLRHQTERAGLHGLFRPHDRRLAEEFDLLGADHAVGRATCKSALTSWKRTAAITRLVQWARSAGRTPFPRPASTHIRRDGEIPDPPRNPAKHSRRTRRSRRAPRRRGRAFPADRSGARRLLNPGDREGHRRHRARGPGLQAAAGQFVRPPRRPPRRTPRASRPARVSTRRRSAAMSAAGRASRINTKLAKALGYGRRDPRSRSSTRHRMRRSSADEISDISEPRREKRQMHRPTPQPVTLGVTATAQALEKLLREGREEFAERRHGRLDAAPPAAAGEIRRRPALRHQVRLRAQGRPAAGDRGAGRGRRSATTARRCCSASPAPARPSPWRR